MKVTFTVKVTTPNYGIFKNKIPSFTLTAYSSFNVKVLYAFLPPGSVFAICASSMRIRNIVQMLF